MSVAPGILPDRELYQAFEQGVLRTQTPLADNQIQPASLDLRLSDKVFRLRASFLPGPNRSIEACLQGDLVIHEMDLTSGAVLETGCVYLAPLQESLNLSDDLHAVMNPKSSTGRLDVFTRVITDQGTAFDRAPAGYKGPLYVEISPRTFPVLARPGDRLVQVRLRRGEAQGGDALVLSVDLEHPQGEPVGFRAKRHAGLVDLSQVGGHDPLAYWEPLFAPKGQLVLDPGEFYILASREPVEIPLQDAAEMAPIAPEIGEFRAHYAGFFDPGFGVECGGARAVLEVRGRDVPFILEHGQSIAKLVYEPMAGGVEIAYGASGSNYQAQGLKLSKHFRHWRDQSWPQLFRP